jgi:hypothetical protein
VAKLSPIFTSHRSQLTSHAYSCACALLNSLAAFLRVRVLYFQSFADSLTKTPGVAHPFPISTRATSHQSRLGKSFRFRSYRHPARNSFRIRSYKITGGWGPLADNSVNSSGSVSLWQIRSLPVDRQRHLFHHRHSPPQCRSRSPHAELQNSLVPQTLAPLGCVAKPDASNGAAIAPSRQCCLSRSHPRGHATPVARMSYTIFLSGRSWRLTQRSN